MTQQDRNTLEQQEKNAVQAGIAIPVHTGEEDLSLLFDAMQRVMSRQNRSRRLLFSGSEERD